MDKILSFTDLHGALCTVTVRYPAPAVFAMSVHKAGSVLLNTVINQITWEAGIPYCDFDDQLFAQGVDWRTFSIQMLNVMETPGVIYSGFRALGALPGLANFRVAKKLLLVRDPRDIAVSFYFSAANSHSIPESGSVRDDLFAKRMEAKADLIDDYIIRGNVDFIFQNLRDYVAALQTFSDIVVYRYEDIIFNKREWVSALCKELRAPLTADQIHEIADRNDIRPTEERPESHVRQVSPGNYLAHLRADTVRYIEFQCADVMTAFGYTHGPLTAV